MDGYLQTKQKECRDMLRQGINYITFILILCLSTTQCRVNTNKEAAFKKASKAIISDKEYLQIYLRICDSLKSWNKYNLYKYNSKFGQIYKVDSLICFNSDGNRLRGAIHVYSNGVSPSESLYYLQGEKINNNWYYFTSATVVLPRKWYQKNDSTPLSFSKMHELSIKEVLDGYLKPNGEINEDFFTREFEGPGWLRYPETLEDLKKLTRKDYEERHLFNVRKNWYGVKKDTSSTLQ